MHTNTDPQDVAYDNEGMIFALAEDGSIVTTKDWEVWEEWHCPLLAGASLALDKTFLIVVGGMEFAACVRRHRGKVWQMIELPDDAVSVALTSGCAYVATHTGRLLVVTLHWQPSLLERLGLSMSITGPILTMTEHIMSVPLTSGLDAIEFCRGEQYDE